MVSRAIQNVKPYSVVLPIVDCMIGGNDCCRTDSETFVMMAPVTGFVETANGPNTVVSTVAFCTLLARELRYALRLCTKGVQFCFDNGLQRVNVYFK